MEKKQGIKSYEVLSEEISEDGKSANVKMKIVYGNWRLGEFMSRIEPKGWSIDCLPCGYLRLFSRSTLTAGPALSSFEIYSK